VHLRQGVREAVAIAAPSFLREPPETPSPDIVLSLHLTNGSAFLIYPLSAEEAPEPDDIAD